MVCYEVSMIPPELTATISALNSLDEQTRDVAADELGDTLEFNRARSPSERQSVLDCLGEALET